MRCRSCGADIPPAWVKAIESNSCPGCGGEIMDSETKGLMDELAQAITKMPNDVQGIVGWLLSNYEFNKIGDAVPTEKFHRKSSKKRREVEEEDDSGGTLPNGMKVDPTYNDFLKRAEGKIVSTPAIEQVKRIKGTASGKFAQLAQAIQGAEDPYGDDLVASKVDAPVTADDQKAYMELKRGGFDPFASLPKDSMGGITDMSQIIDPQEIIALQRQNSSDLLPQEEFLAQTAEGAAVVNVNRYKRLKAQEAIDGGGLSSFRRG